MRAILDLGRGLHEELMTHLLPPKCCQEQGAFLFVQAIRSDREITFDVIEVAKLGRRDFAVQAGDYLEMADEARAGLIKRAHDLNASLVEMHSHLGRWPAAFSPSDRMGLAETVPHMWWRLKKCPYVAIVVAKSGFDALLWLDDPTTPRGLEGIRAGDRFLRPTNNSLRGWP